MYDYSGLLDGLAIMLAAGLAVILMLWIEATLG
jgi:hypothetical protein